MISEIVLQASFKSVLAQSMDRLSRGFTHETGDKWRRDCYSCSCQPLGKVECLPKYCAKTCKDQQGFTHQAGDRWKVDCNECECKYGGEVVCESKVCNKACRDHNGYT